MFRRYEPFIQAIVQNFPSTITLDNGKYSKHTFMCRLRDSITSLLEYGWTSPIDTEQLKKIRPELEITIQDGLIVARKKVNKALEKSGAVVDINAPQDEFSFTIANPEPVVLMAIAILLDRKIVTKPAKFFNVPPELLTQVQSQFDVGIQQDQTTGFIVMI